MGRRSSSSSAAAAAKSKNNEVPKALCESSVVSKLQMLRDFVGTTTWSEADLSSCLRQCGYNVELAAERLMTGQFQGSNPFSTSNDGKRKTSFFAMSSSSPSKMTTDTKSEAWPGITVTSSSVKRRRETPQFARKKVASSGAPTSSIPVVTPGVMNSAVKVKSSHHFSTGPLLLCQRWVVGCCTTRHGHVAYQEKLSISNSLVGPPMVRFRGYSIDGTLPDNLGAMLTPLLRCDQEGPRLISIKAEGLMEARQVPIGGEVPLSLR